MRLRKDKKIVRERIKGLKLIREVYDFKYVAVDLNT